jgi:hypothetical protein
MSSDVRDRAPETCAPRLPAEAQIGAAPRITLAARHR